MESSEMGRSQTKNVKAEEILENTLDGVVAGVVNLTVDSDESMSEDILKELTSTVRIEEDSLAAENLTAQMMMTSENDKPEVKPEVKSEMKSEAQKQAVSPTVSLFLPPEDDTGSPDENEETERDPEQGTAHLNWPILNNFQIYTSDWSATIIKHYQTLPVWKIIPRKMHRRSSVNMIIPNPYQSQTNRKNPQKGAEIRIQ